MKNKFFWESGQAIVLVLLSLSVVLTIVLFVISRSVTDITTSTEQADSVRAFSAAEAGVENAFVVGGNLSGNFGDASYNATVSDFAKSLTGINYPIPLISGDLATIWFVDHDADGNLTCGTGSSCFANTDLRLCWGNKDAPTNDTSPAIEVSIYYKANNSDLNDLTDVKIARITADPYEVRRAANSFDVSYTPCDVAGTKYPFRLTFNFNDLGISNVSSGRLLFAKVRFIYNTETSHALGAKVNSGTTAFPSQGKMISSLGSSGESNRKVNVFQGWPEFPFSGLAIFSLPGITK